MSNLNNSVYLCKEVFDENSKPTRIEIEEQASRLGIDPVKELHLLSIAKQCLLEPLPSNWIPCYIEKENKYFYFNDQNKISQWEHPLDEHYRQIIEKIRSEDSSTATAENPASHKYEVENGIKTRRAFSHTSGYSFFIEIQNLVNSILVNFDFKLLSQDNSIRLSSSVELNSDGTMELNGS
ncbi:centrosomal protein of 164 kDa [Sipha flava]|uniref:Centrosomal protein of 164 kDa n=1 Tax=Sipha flava TaxID=143950 RepID=A0A8B8F8T4_9HEMI|nr:centrosomal protein of 164 kDa [Sipha flava]